MFGFIPHNIELYKLALIHKSASVTLDDGRQVNNERLEFLGDAVIESVTSDYLFIEFPDQNEGFLTQLRSKMVSRQSLNEVAKRLKLDTHVITHSSASFSQKHIYGDAFEAMMGAIYLDQGYDFVNRLLINRIFGDYLRTGALLEEETDFKSRLIEWCQKNHTIRFITSHDKSYSSAHPLFNCKVLIDDIEAGYGSGESKKEAEQHAAYSVSQGFREEDCAKLFDRLDAIERGIAPAQSQRHGTDDSADDTDAVPRNGEAKADRKNDGDVTSAKGHGRSRSARRARKRAAQADLQTEIQADVQADIQMPTDGNTETDGERAGTDTMGGNAAAEVQSAEGGYAAAENAISTELNDTAEAVEAAPCTPDAQDAESEEKRAVTTAEAEEVSATDAVPAEPAAPKRRTRRRTPKTAPASSAADAAESDNMPDVGAVTTEEQAGNGQVKEATVAQADTDITAADTGTAPKRRTRRRTLKAAAAKAEEVTSQAAGTLPTETVPEESMAGTQHPDMQTESDTPAAESGAAPKRRPRRRASKTAAEEGSNAEAGKPEEAATAGASEKAATTMTTDNTETAVNTAE